jgi:hypothetical protein
VPNNLGLILVAIGFALHLWAMLWRAYYLSALMVPLVMLGLIVTLFGHRVAEPFLFPLGFLILMVPLPLAERVGPLLEGWTATGATAFAPAAPTATPTPAAVWRTDATNTPTLEVIILPTPRSCSPALEKSYRDQQKTMQRLLRPLHGFV